MWAATGFDQPATPARSASRSAFDVCHVGVVLRVVLGMQLVLALGVAHVAVSPADWLVRWSQALATALPASLLWLVLACAGRSLLERMSPLGQWGSAVLLGALAGLYGEVQSSMLDWWMGGAQRSWWGVCPAMLTGAAFASVTLAWLRQRGHSELPAQAQARLAELQARIRPHFLFNTLNTAIALVQIEPARAEAVLEDLAELFRQALTSPHLRASLTDEIDLAQRYLRIEQLRFGERLTLHWTLDPAAGEAEVPALMLQPLVENAVKHGVEADPDGGWLRVSTHVKAGQAVLTITNSIPANPQAASTAGHGIALRNVRQRLRLMHDVEASFAAGVHKGETAEHASVYVVRVSVPLKPGMNAR
ncbi:histidine kinase [Aquabacterium sp.]|uniref:sensor histidine kinase n=1 Tax=Aquabacterium sp. TaxID=1872578 RepID=UPI00248A3708|nr:histidine kinase [Aquabacterium sp.]MDI1259790.1 histidine kinase [Aquabacterium sp.]